MKISYSRTWVVVPTFNERANIPTLLQRIVATGPWNVLIVDDNSPDGTGLLAEELRATYPQLAVLHRPKKQGLGPAYREGLRHVLGLGAEAIVQCDADLSHPPEIIPTLVDALKDKDVAIASRYIPGGRAEDNFHRRMISIIGNAYIRSMLGADLHDWSSGFKAWRPGILKKVLDEPLQTIGYAFQMEMLWNARNHGAALVEVPLVFVQRTSGVSKFTNAIILENIRMAWKLRKSSRSHA